MNDTCTFMKREQMAERYARLEQFNCSDGDWKSYQERLEQLFVVNEVEANDCSVLTLCTSFWQSLILCTSLWQAILYWHASIFLYVCIQPFSLK